MENWTPKDCELHEKKLSAMAVTMNQLADGQAAILTSQARMEEALSGLRREMESGFKGTWQRQDATNGRVTSLEKNDGSSRVGIAELKTKVTKLEAEVVALESDIGTLDNKTAGLEKDMAAQEAFTPGMFKELEDLKQRAAATASQVDHDHGVLSGAAKIGMIIWAALLATAAALAWVWDRFISPAAPVK